MKYHLEMYWNAPNSGRLAILSNIDISSQFYGCKCHNLRFLNVLRGCTYRISRQIWEAVDLFTIVT